VSRRPARSVAAQVKFASGLRCCVCHGPGDQIHHIDPEGGSDDPGNLAFLCFNCHDGASRTGGLRAKLTPQDIRLFRDRWYEEVESQRSRASTRSLESPSSRTPEDVAVEAAIDALAIAAIWGFDWNHATHDWSQLVQFRNGVDTSVLLVASFAHRSPEDLSRDSTLCAVASMRALEVVEREERVQGCL